MSRKYRGSSRNAQAEDLSQGSGSGPGSGSALNAGRLDLPYFAPTVLPSYQSPFGYSYRLDKNRYQDEPSILFETRHASLAGYELLGSGAINSEWNMAQVDYFWDNAFKWLVELAEGRDGYRPDTWELTDAKTLRYYLEHLLFAGWNLRAAYPLYYLTMEREGMGTLRDDFAGKKARMEYDIRQMRGFVSIPLIDELIDMYAGPKFMFPGGPLYTCFLDGYNLNWGTNNQHNWLAPIDLDNGTTGGAAGAALGHLLSNVEYSIKEIHGETTDANDKADYRKIDSLLRMLGFGTMKMNVAPAAPDPLTIEYMLNREAFVFLDTQGALGDDIMVSYPSEIYGTLTNDIQIRRDCIQKRDGDRLWYAGLCPEYCHAYDTRYKYNVDTPDDGVRFGAIFKGGGDESDVSHFTSLFRVYTMEDGWIDSVGGGDVSDQDFLEDMVWSMPWILRHQSSRIAVIQQDTVEAYNEAEALGTSLTLPLGHIWEGLRVVLHEYFGIPYQR